MISTRETAKTSVVVPGSLHLKTGGELVAYIEKNNRIEIFCPTCAAAGIRRKLMEVDANTHGTIWPYCKACKRNVKIELKGVRSA